MKFCGDPKNETAPALAQVLVNMLNDVNRDPRLGGTGFPVFPTL